MRETRWHMIRHAPVANPDGRIYGASDKPADVSDKAAFRVLASRLPSGAVTLVSHLQRTHQTLDAIREAGLDAPRPLVDRRFGEQDFGDWVGLTYDEAKAKYRESYNRFWLAPVDERPPNGESFLDLIARVGPALEESSETLKGRDVICVAHGGTIRAALALALGIEGAHAVSFAIDTLSTTVLDRLHPTPGFAGGWRVRGVNLPAR